MCSALISTIKGGFVTIQPEEACPKLWGGEDMGMTGGSHGDDPEGLMWGSCVPIHLHWSFILRNPGTCAVESQEATVWHTASFWSIGFQLTLTEGDFFIISKASRMCDSRRLK